MSAPDPRVKRGRYASLLLLVVAAGAIGGWLVVAQEDPLAVAVEQVLAGESSACEAFREALEASRAEHPEGSAAPGGYQDAMVRCVDERIAQAEALPTPAERERALLLVADPQATLDANPAQLERINERVAVQPGALVGGKSRIRARAFDVVGDVPVAAVRDLLAGRQLAVRACHAKALAAKADHSSDVQLSMNIDKTGLVSGVALAEPAKDGPLAQCLAVVFNGATIPGGGAARATVQLGMRSPG